MDQKAFESACEKMRLAKTKLEAMHASDTLGDLADAWADFLINVQRTFTRLIKAAEAGSSKGWCDQIKNLRKTDPLLSYVRHARNADEHGIEKITENSPASIGIGAVGESMYIKHLTIGPFGIRGQIEASPKLTIEWCPESVQLVQVVDRGATYDVPCDHLGKPIHDVTPIVAAELTVSYLEGIIAEAKKKFG